MRLLRLQNPSTLIPWLGAVLMVGVGLVVGYGELYGAAAVLALIGLAVVFWKPELVYMVSVATIVVGQMARLPLFGGEGSIIPNDVLLPVLIFFWLLQRLASGTWKFPRMSLHLPLLFFVGAMAASLWANIDNFTGRELLGGALYFVRWLEYAALLFLSFDFLGTPKRAKAYIVALVWTGVIISLLGFVQLRVYPDFSAMVPQGWDPHIGRLLSTWFDPNFLAGYLSFLITIALAIALSKGFTQARWWWVAIMIMSLAVVFTFSRSGYVALVAGVGIVTLYRSRTILFLGLLAMICTILFVPRVQERVIGIRTVDETAQLRLVSWNNAREVIGDHPVFGVGYNTYRYVQVQYGFLKDSTEHSASGSDSSLLTVWVTTGFIGVIAFLWLYGALLWEAWKTWHDKHLSREWKGYGLGLFAGLAALLLHAQFVNGLLYPHIMQVIWMTVAGAIMVRQKS